MRHESLFTLTTAMSLALLIIGCGKTNPASKTPRTTQTNMGAVATTSRLDSRSHIKIPDPPGRDFCKHLRRHPRVRSAYVGPSVGEITVVLRGGTDLGSAFDVSERIVAFANEHTASLPQTIKTITIRRNLYDNKVISQGRLPEGLPTYAGPTFVQLTRSANGKWIYPGV